MKRVGILGGGQLGLMLYQKSLSYPVEIHFMDPDPKAPCARITPNFFLGDYRKKEDVLLFAKDLDVIGIEIENVNSEALIHLKNQGKKVIPDPEVLQIIQNKYLQKQFYFTNHIPTAPILKEPLFPLVQKLNEGGYDGKGVKVLKNREDLKKAFREPAFFETMADIKKELSVLVVKQGDFLRSLPVVEQVFDSNLNLVDYLICPAEISDQEDTLAREIAQGLIANFEGDGLFAVELFLNRDGSIWVNETAPRLHNSGHLGMDAWTFDQFEAFLSLLVGKPVPIESKNISPSAMINLIGKGSLLNEKMFHDLLKQKGVYLHWYQKSESRVGRKMGHLNILAEDNDQLKQRISQIKRILKEIDL